jgi:hypothetical protein
LKYLIMQFYAYNKKFWEEIITSFPLIRHGPHRKRRLQQFLVSEVKFLPSCCEATIGGLHTDCWEGLMKYAFEMGSGVVI